MLNQLLFLLLISISYGCIPTAPVTTTTVAPNVTTTTVASNTTNTTTTTTTTTTVAPAENRCCRYPLASISINTANPIETAWNGCNQSINFVCGLSSYLNTTVYKGNGVAADLNGTSSLIIPGDSPNIVSRSDVGPSNVTVSCNTTSHLWSISSQIGKESYYFSCIYHLANGSWLLGSTGTQIV